MEVVMVGADGGAGGGSSGGGGSGGGGTGGNGDDGEDESDKVSSFFFFSGPLIFLTCYFCFLIWPVCHFGV